MTQELARITDPMEFTQDKVDLLKRTFCKGATDDELQLFMHACKRTGLDPFVRQIHAVKRWNKEVGREVMTVQTGIDGYRLIAERTRQYVPGPEPTFTYNDKGELVSATAHIKKLAADGSWHNVSATAHWDEYVCTKKDGSPTHMWASKPHIMLAKCAEALALRRAFPAELSGVYTAEEMQTDGDDEGKEHSAPLGGSRNSPAPAPKHEAPAERGQGTAPTGGAGAADDGLGVDEAFMRRWCDTLRSHGFVDDDAAVAAMAHLMGKAKITLASLRVGQRRTMLNKAAKGGFDHLKYIGVAWGKFADKAEEIATKMKVAPPVLHKAIAAVVDANGGDSDRLDSEMLSSFLVAMEVGSFDWDTAQIREPASTAA